jgi:Protein of unknown function DUF262
MVTSISAHLEETNSIELLEEVFQPEEYDVELPILDSPRPDGRERRLVTHPYDFMIKSLKDQVEDGSIVLADDFQRRRVWDDAKSSRLIESLLINVPIPVCYFAELEDGSYSVIDGQQRLTAIYRYLNNEFGLRSLKVRPDLNKKRFCDLGLADSRTIKNRSLRCIVILKESDPDIRFDVFDRLNSNVVKLNPQELRNSMYRGDLSKLIKKLSGDEKFKEIRRVKDVDKRMQDCEMVLRFFAFHYHPESYRGFLARFLDDYLRQYRRMNDYDMAQHEATFRRVIDDAYFVFGDDAFRRYDQDKNQWDMVINKSIYEIITLYFAQVDSTIIRSHKDGIVESLKKLCSNQDFQSYIGGATSATIRIQSRLDLWRDSLTSLGIQVNRIRVGNSNNDG